MSEPVHTPEIPDVPAAPLRPTPGQTVGPFFGYGLPYDGGEVLVDPHHPAAVRLFGTVLDGAGNAVPDALIEIWQPDGAGRVPHEGGSLRRDGVTFTGWGRAATNALGRYAFVTVRPGATEEGAAAFFAVTVFARGLLDRLFTRAYLPGQPALAQDPLLVSLSAAERETLMTEDTDVGLRFDIRLQGERETVFLRYPGH
jgi:protocatechuate 3,4-dioxygenase alpha subunit